MRQRDVDRIARMEADGTMNDRRAQLRAWFQANPDSTPADAVRALEFSHADHMYIISDSIRFDLASAVTKCPEAE